MAETAVANESKSLCSWALNLAQLIPSISYKDLSYSNNIYFLSADWVCPSFFYFNFLNSLLCKAAAKATVYIQVQLKYTSDQRITVTNKVHKTHLN